MFFSFAVWGDNPRERDALIPWSDNLTFTQGMIFAKNKNNFLCRPYRRSINLCLVTWGGIDGSGLRNEKTSNGLNGYHQCGKIPKNPSGWQNTK